MKKHSSYKVYLDNLERSGMDLRILNILVPLIHGMKDVNVSGIEKKIAKEFKKARIENPLIEYSYSKESENSLFTEQIEINPMNWDLFKQGYDYFS